MRRCLTFLFILCLASLQARADQTQSALSPSWLKLYQYKKTDHGYFSGVISPEFFFSPAGATDPVSEFQAAVKAFSNPHTVYGKLKLPAACAFPARFEVAQKLLDTKWPQPQCPELTEWLNRLDADKVSIGYASAYTGNPASLMGHTYIRLSKNRSKSEAEALDLLSYAVGFLAQPDRQYGQLRYFYKGITGGFKATYDIEPFYMKVGLYNNSESRDLFEQELKLTSEEVQFLQKHLWELIQNAEFRYYFFDENCSYRILTLLEAVKPELNFETKDSWIVLPPETVRELLAKGVLDPQTTFRSSVRRRLKWRRQNLTQAQITQLSQARSSHEALSSTVDVAVLDTLIEEWKYRNYRAKTQLPAKEAALMEKTFAQRAQIQQSSLPLPADSEMAQLENLIPPYKSHRPYALRLGIGHINSQFNSNDEGYLLIAGQAGAHSEYQTPKGYFDASSIEYLSFAAEYGFESEKWIDWKIRLAHVKAIEPISSSEKNWSWQFQIDIDKNCGLCGSGGVGGALQWHKLISYLMPIAAFTSLEHKDFDPTLGGGYEAGLRYLGSNTLISITFKHLFARHENLRVTNFYFRQFKNMGPLLALQNESGSLDGFKTRLLLSITID